MKHLLKTLIFFPLMILSACVSLLPEPGTPAKKIWLDPVVSSTENSRPSTDVLSITRPTATHMLDSERLRVRNLKGELPLIDHIAGVEWQEHLPLMTQRHLVKNIKRAEIFKAVGFEEDSFDRDIVLETDIQNFDVVILKDKMYAEVTLSAKLLQAKGRDILWQKTFTATAPIVRHTLVDFIAGLTSAYEDVLGQVIGEL